MKKILLAQNIVILALLLQGCGSSSSSNTQTPTTSPTTSPSSDNTPTTTTTVAANEPYYKYAWHLDASNSALENAGYTINPSADIHIHEAWNVTRGAGVKVAVIDDGFEVGHEDLQSNIITAYNADNGSQNVAYSGNDGTHGNTCAGFIVSPINSIGSVGVSPDSKLIAIKQETNSDANLIKAFEYAKNQGAKVISCSWGTGQVSQAVEAEMKSLYNAGITILFASGNDGRDLDANGIHDESESAWVIGVGASSENNDVTTYSDYGSNIDILAPGGDLQRSSGILGIDDMGAKGASNQRNLVNNNYSFTDGTSFACPVAAGVVALMYSVNPSITPKRVREILIQTTEKVGGTSLYGSNGFDKSKKRAYGKINANQAVAAASL